MDTVVTKKDYFNNPTNVTKILKPFSFRKSTDTPSVDQFSKKEKKKKKRNLGSNAKNLNSKRNLSLSHQYKRIDIKILKT